LSVPRKTKLMYIPLVEFSIQLRPEAALCISSEFWQERSHYSMDENQTQKKRIFRIFTVVSKDTSCLLLGVFQMFD
jgi:hypothetical protein